MIIGAHAILFTTDAAADRAFFRDVLAFDHVDDGGGWLIFRLPPAELACHPAGESQHVLYLMCDNAEAFRAKMAEHAVPCTPIHVEDWGRLVQITLPGGSTLKVYEPTHNRPS